MNTYQLNENHGVYTGMASLFTSLVAGMACIGPMLGIVLGVSGLGWLSSYSYLSGPASVVSLLLLAVAITMYRRRKVCCANKRKHTRNRMLLIATSLVVVGVNAFEYVILPNLL